MEALHAMEHLCTVTGHLYQQHCLIQYCAALQYCVVRVVLHTVLLPHLGAQVCAVDVSTGRKLVGQVQTFLVGSSLEIQAEASAAGVRRAWVRACRGWLAATERQERMNSTVDTVSTQRMNSTVLKETLEQ